MFVRCAISLGLVFMTFSGAADTAMSLDGFMREGRFRDGVAAFASAKNNSERFSLAVLQALDGLQQFSTGFNRLGINPELAQSGIPFLRVLTPNRRQAPSEPATPEKIAGLFGALKQSLERANATLATVDDAPFSVEVNLSQARMDLDGDGTVTTDELLLKSLGRSLGFRPANQTQGDIVIHFDSADAAWLKGYTHLLMGLLDVLMAYDWNPVWNQCAQAAFRNPQPAPPIAKYNASTASEFGMDVSRIADYVAGIHEMRLELVNKDGLRKARDEFRAMTACSRVCWKRALAETDDDHEWLPSPTQTGPGGAKVTSQQVEGWQKVLDELDSILTGKALLPHWRMKKGVGINVDKLVNAPPRLDLVMLIQGAALIPYLEEGAVSDQTRWRTLMEPFGPGFMLFAIWSN